MSGFSEEARGIYRLKVPFKVIYTSVFLIEQEGRRLLVDCATTAEDVDNCILPALAKRGLAVTDLDALVLTHSHGDHAGGLARLQELSPSLAVITDTRPLFGALSIYPLAGHTEDSIGVLDVRTGTLISGDGLQGAGVWKYRCYTKDRAAYFKTLQRIENDDRIKNILFSHAYEPWCKDSVAGRESVLACLQVCAEVAGGNEE